MWGLRFSGEKIGVPVDMSVRLYADTLAWLLYSWLNEWIPSVVQPIQLREVFGFGYAVGVQRKEDACFLFSQVQSFKNGIAHLLRTVCADTERKGDYRFKAVNLHAALVGQSDGMPYLTLIQNAVLAECL